MTEPADPSPERKQEGLSLTQAREVNTAPATIR